MSESFEIDFSQCATVSLAEAAHVLGIHRSTAWELYKRGEFPVPVLRLGSRLRVGKRQLADLLATDRSTPDCANIVLDGE